MSLPTRAIDRLFERLAATYGAAWARQWEAVPIMDVKSLWAHELSIYADRLEVLAWALENLPDHPPNAIQFRNLCRSAPAPVTKALPLPPANPERLKAELAKLGHIAASERSGSAPRVDGRAWARRILGRAKDGETINPTSLRFAREALRHEAGG